RPRRGRIGDDARHVGLSCAEASRPGYTVRQGRIRTVKVLKRRSWTGFRQFLEGYLAQDRMRRGQLLFRGQSDFQWPLDTTLDRVRRFASDAERQQYND